MRLGVLDMLKTDAESREGLASYLLHHLATHDIEVLRQWPSAYRIALRASEGKLAIDGDLRDLEQIVRNRMIGQTEVEHEMKLQLAEMVGAWLLEAVAKDMRQFYGGYGGGSTLTEKRLNLHGTSLSLLKMLREGELSKLCIDAYPFLAPPITNTERLRRKAAKKAARDKRLGRRQLV